MGSGGNRTPDLRVESRAALTARPKRRAHTNAYGIFFLVLTHTRRRLASLVVRLASSSFACVAPAAPWLVIFCVVLLD